MRDGYNDNELLYLVSENDDDAFAVLITKYLPLIHARLRSFKINKKNYDDFVQECLIVLVKAIRTYRMDSPKTFNKFFDLIMTRRIIDIINKEKNYYYNVVLTGDNTMLLNEGLDQYYEVSNYSRPHEFNLLSELEKSVYIKRYEEGLKAKEIAIVLALDIKQVYNSLLRIKKKLRTIR